MTRTSQWLCALATALAACSSTIGDPLEVEQASGLRDAGGDGDGDGDGDGNAPGDGDSPIDRPAPGPDSGFAAADADAWIVAAVQPDGDCVVAYDNPIVPIGLYDLGNGDPGPGCNKSYRVTLQLASAGRDVLELHDAQITLMDLEQRTIVFNRDAQQLANPLSFIGTRILLPPAESDRTTHGVITVDLIPAAYAAQLDAFDGQQILAEIRLNVTGGSGSRVSIPAFVYPIDLCIGCLSICLTSLEDQNLDDVYGDDCTDNAAADGRLCIDADC